ncbi:MAG: helix-turn-helix domain-containing protein, partial [Steroidobacteraceae bacterium]
MAAAQPGPSSLGARLRSAREQAGLTVIQAAERLHVDPQLIEALEGERFEEVGASVYVRGHIRHFAELVGESPEALQELYATSAHAALTPDLTRVPKGEASTGAPSVLLVPAVLVVAVVAVIGVVWWVAGTLNTLHLAHRAGAAASAGGPGGPVGVGGAGGGVGGAGASGSPAAPPGLPPVPGPGAAHGAPSDGAG